MGDQQDNILVSISCLTFNHAPFLRKCFDGFLMQKCDFKFEVLIHDDASTDGTIDIINEYKEKYPFVFKPIIQEENLWSKGQRGFNQRYNFPRALGRYIAMCEGDDYWTDRLKLQKQVAFLQEHPEFSLACGGYVKANTITKVCEDMLIKQPEMYKEVGDIGFEFTLDDLHKNWLVKTLTVVFRKDTLNLEDFQPYKHVRDVHLYYHLIKKGKGFYFYNLFGVYNVHDGGVHSGSSTQGYRNSQYQVYYELYAKNRDPYLRKKALTATLAKLSFDLRNSYARNTFFRRLILLIQAVGMLKSPSDLGRLGKVIGAYIIYVATRTFIGEPN